MPDAKDAQDATADGAGRYGKKWERALDTVAAQGVKVAKFAPSGRRLVTVVGRLGDEFVDPERHYCSCSNFYFRVLGGKEELCYHLLSYRIAEREGKFETVEFSDEEYGAYFSAVVMDVFDVLLKS